MKSALLPLLLLAGCARDLALPAAIVSPVVTGFAPDHAFAGERLLVTGQALDPIPARNLVHFARGTAAGEAFDAAGALLVHVPADAGSGALAVATVAGLGAPSAASFSYRGLGHLRTGQSATTLQALHRPPGIVAAGGDLWIASTLFRAVQSRSGKFAHLEHKVAALVSDGAVMFAADEDVGNHDLYRIDPANPAKVVGPVPVGAWSLRALALSQDVGGNPQLWVAGDDGTTSGYLARYSGDAGLSPLELRPLPLLRVLGVVANRDGSRVAVAGQRAVAGSSTLQTGVLVVDTSSLSTVPLWVTAPAGYGLPTGALASLGADIFVGLDDGRIGDLALAGPAASYSGFLDTLSNTPVGALKIFPGGPAGSQVMQLLVAKPNDRTLLAMDLGNGGIAWGVPLRGRPSALAYDPAGLVFAADETANFVDAIDASNGQYLNRISFEAALGDPAGASCGAAYDPYSKASAGKSSPRYLVVARNQFALVTVDAQSLQLGKPLDLVRGSTSPAHCVGVAPDGSAWVLHQTEVGRIAAGTKKEVILGTLKHLPAPPTNLAFLADGRVLLQFPTEVKVVGADGQALGGSSFPGNLELISASDTQVLAVWSGPGSKPLVPHAALYSLDAFVAGGAPTARFDDPTPNLGFAGAVALPDRTLLFFDSSAALGVPGALPLLGPSLLPQPEETAPVKAHSPVAASPDGRYFLWTRLVLPDLVLHLTHGVAGATILNAADMPLLGPLQGAAFDPSGERVLVPVGSEDAIQIYE